MGITDASTAASSPWRPDGYGSSGCSSSSGRSFASNRAVWCIFLYNVVGEPATFFRGPEPRHHVIKACGCHIGHCSYCYRVCGLPWLGDWPNKHNQQHGSLRVVALEYLVQQSISIFCFVPAVHCFFCAEKKSGLSKHANGWTEEPRVSL